MQLEFLKEFKSENIQTGINSRQYYDQQESRSINDSFAAGLEYHQDGRASDENLVLGGGDFLRLQICGY